MKHILNKCKLIACMTLAILSFTSCGYKVTYNLSGGSIPPEAQTFSVAYFPNNARMVAPTLIKIFRVNDPMTAGLSIGACSHAIGTSKALQIGETEGI